MNGCLVVLNISLEYVLNVSLLTGINHDKKRNAKVKNKLYYSIMSYSGGFPRVIRHVIGYCILPLCNWLSRTHDPSSLLLISRFSLRILQRFRWIFAYDSFSIYFLEILDNSQHDPNLLLHGYPSLMVLHL